MSENTSGMRQDREVEQTHLEGTTDAVVSSLRGEADELEARDDVDNHLQDVIDGLRLNANELSEAIQQSYERRGVAESQELTDDDECPSCGRRTLTERGITVDYNDGSTGGATWLNCINCDWDNKGGDDE
jgi:rRNA maturation endonuclease Nob1